MSDLTAKRTTVTTLALSLLTWGTLLAGVPTMAAAQTTIGPYTLHTFATGGTTASGLKATAPDSIAVDGTHVFIGYANGVASDGSDGKSSTIVEYDTAGHYLNSFSVAGHNDGLRVDPATHLVYAEQNEDGNVQLQVIDPVLNSQTLYLYGPTPHGGGYDDLVFRNGTLFLSASSPNFVGNVNNLPAIVSATLDNVNHTVAVTPVLNGNATATDIATGATGPLNLTDPDSMTLDTHGNLVLDDQSGSQLAIVSDPGTNLQAVKVLGIQNGVNVDDTAFATASQGEFLIADRNSNTIYSLTANNGFTVGSAFSASPGDNSLGSLDFSNGLYSQVVIGLNSPHGLGFIPAADVVPEGSSAIMLLSGALGVLGFGLRRKPRK